MIILPYPPSGNRYWRVYQSRIVKSAEARTYQNAVRLLAINWRRKFWDGRLAARLELYAPNKIKMDLDNSAKVVLDALQSAEVYENDSQIDDLHIVRCGIEGHGKIVITLSKIVEPG
ncbi:MAG: RusA family crossover junction endodeoxyribonuclease [Pseudomonadota bacterium]